MANWWSIIKFSRDEAHIYLQDAFKTFIRKNPDATDEEILEYLSDMDNIYDEYDMIREEDKRLGTMKDVENFNERFGRRQKPPVVLTDYHKEVFLPALSKVMQDKKQKHGAALMGSALIRELAKEPGINKSTIEKDLEIVSEYFETNSQQGRQRAARIPTIYTKEGNLDIAATERARQEAMAERNKDTTIEDVKERLNIAAKREEERQKRIKRRGNRF